MSRSDWLIAGGLAVGLLLLYLGTFRQVHNQCVDCTDYAFRIERGELRHLFQGSHLIYLWLLSLIHEALSSFIAELDGFTTAQVLNSLMACLSVSVFYLLARSISIRRWLSLCLSLVLAFSYAYWLYATDVEVHAPAVFLYLLTLLVALRLPPNSHAWKYVALGVLTALAILFHSFSGLMGLVIIAVLLLTSEDRSGRPRLATPKQLRGVFLYGFTAAVLVTAAYFYVANQVQHLQTADQILSWIMEFRDTVGFESRAALPLSSSLILSATGIIRAILGSIVWVNAPVIGDVLQRTFSEKCMGEELYLVRNLSPEIALMLSAFSSAAGAILATLTMISVPGLARALRRLSPAAVVLVMWLALSTVMNVYLAPGSHEHWGMYWLPPFLLAVGLGLSLAVQSEGKHRNLIFGLTGALFVTLLAANFGNILPLARANNDLYLHRISWYQANTTHSDLVISPGGYKWNSYTDYYLNATVVKLDEPSRSMEYLDFSTELEAQIGQIQSSGGRIFVMQTALDPELCQARYGNWDMTFYETFRQDLEPRLDCFQATGISVCEIVN